MIDVFHISKEYSAGRGIFDVSFQVEPGEVFGLLGANGAGKTTLFNCLSDEIQPDMGNALICDDEGEHVLLPDEIGYCVFGSGTSGFSDRRRVRPVFHGY